MIREYRKKRMEGREGKGSGGDGGRWKNGRSRVVRGGGDGVGERETAGEGVKVTET